MALYLSSVTSNTCMPNIFHYCPLSNAPTLERLSVTSTSLPFAMNVMLNLSIVSIFAVHYEETVVTVNEPTCEQCKIWKFCLGQSIKKHNQKSKTT